jgi:hypothetical protein
MAALASADRLISFSHVVRMEMGSDFEDAHLPAHFALKRLVAAAWVAICVVSHAIDAGDFAVWRPLVQVSVTPDQKAEQSQHRPLTPFGWRW